MGNVAGIVRDTNIQMLDLRLNEHASDILRDLRGDESLGDILKKPRGAGSYTNAGKIAQDWLGDGGFFGNVPAADREKILRETYEKALTLKGNKRIRTIWVCLWTPSNQPTFLTAVMPGDAEVTVLLLAFRVGDFETSDDPNQSPVHVFGRESDLVKLLKAKGLNAGSDAVRELERP